MLHQSIIPLCLRRIAGHGLLDQLCIKLLALLLEFAHEPIIGSLVAFVIPLFNVFLNQALAVELESQLAVDSLLSTLLLERNR